jgi:microcystin-dependent protein
MKSAAVNAGDNILATQYDNLRNDAYGGSMLLPHAQSSPGLTLKVEAGVCYIGITRVIYAGGNSPSFTAPSANPRIDLLTIDSSGTLAITQGTENASPVAPTYPTNKMVLCEVYNRVSETLINDADSGSNGYIYNDVRQFIGGSYIADSSQMANGVVGPSQLAATVGLLSAGMILAYGASSAPTGWLTCDGSAVSRTTYAALFAIIGTTYGAGDGSTTFNVPDLRARVPGGYKSGDANFGTLGGTGGEATHVLTTTEMPSHSHSYPSTGNFNGWPGNAVGWTGGSGSPGPTSSTGGGGAHNNLQPYITLYYIIKT